MQAQKEKICECEFAPRQGTGTSMVSFSLFPRSSRAAPQKLSEKLALRPRDFVLSPTRVWRYSFDVNVDRILAAMDEHGVRCLLIGSRHATLPGSA
jgi:hypothetical protein